MPTLKFWDAATGSYVPIGTTGGSGGVNPEDIPNEVLVDATGAAPSDPEVELWVDEADPGTPPVSGINDLNDVDTATVPPAIDDALTWNGAAWSPKTATATLDGLSDVSVAGAGAGDALIFNGTVWTNEPNVTKVTVSPTAPIGPNLGDIWITP